MEENENVKQRNKHAEEKKPRIFLKIIIILIVLVIVLAGGAVLWYNMSLSGTGTAEESVNLEIPLGSGSSSIAKMLKDNDLIKNELVFKIYVKLNNITNFQAGKYTLTKNMSIPEIIDSLQNGILFKNTSYNVTFVEGKTFPYVAKVIAENTDNTEQDVYDLLEDEEYIDSLINEYWFITDEIKNKDIYYALEGYLSPNTYSFDEKDIEVKEIFKTLLDQMGKELEPYRQDIENSKYSVHEILTLASVIETEAIFDKDRKDISSVFYNRLDSNMSLGSDITTYYAFKIEKGTRDITRNEIDTYNPYNTRGPNMNGKLPVGPVAMPSKESIEAAIYPNTTDYYYFVADNKGNVYFTKTYQEHEAKVNEIKSSGTWIEF